MNATAPRSLMDGDPFIETARLRLRQASLDDAGFFLRLVNEPSFLQYVGDKLVRNLADARRYIETGPLASYADHGFGLYLVLRKTDDTAIGICGLMKRQNLNDPDIGFAFLPEYWSQGYAREAAQAVIERAARLLGLRRLCAVTAPDNRPSIGLLSGLGFVFEKEIEYFDDSRPINLYRRSSGTLR